VTPSDSIEAVPVSALQHFVYCPRQCALIHVERVFDENLFTLRGRSVHERAHSGESEARGGLRIERALPVWSKQHGLIGKTDVVEFRSDEIHPVEYKSGRSRQGRRLLADSVQLCAQTLCLEEMFSEAIATGSLYYAASNQRELVAFDEDLRARTVDIVDEVRTTLASKRLPPPVNDDRCPDCSLIEACVPKIKAVDRERLEEHRRNLYELES